MYREPGKYRHYKGGEYEVIGLALKEDSITKLEDGAASGYGDRFVVYRPLTPGSLLETSDYSDCGFWLRSLQNFNDMVHVDTPRHPHQSCSVPRFVYIGKM